VERPQPARRDRSREAAAAPPQARDASQHTTDDGQAYGPGASQPKTPRVRRAFEWPVVRSDDLTPQQA
jgi:hypothetical protein